MKKYTDEDLQKALDEYSGKSEDELINDLSGFNVNAAEFDSFAEMMLPMLDDTQKKRLEQIRKMLLGD